jgi:cytochrome c-type biogenesis protein CcmH
MGGVVAMVLAVAVGGWQPDPAALEREARLLETRLIAPCCWTQPVSEHRSEASDEVKRQIRALLAGGKSRQEVLDAFVAQYGPRILAEPPARGVGGLLYVGLPLAFVLGGVALVLFLGQAGVRQRVEAAREASPADDAAYAERLDEELRQMD